MCALWTNIFSTIIAIRIRPRTDNEWLAELVDPCELKFFPIWTEWTVHTIILASRTILRRVKTWQAPTDTSQTSLQDRIPPSRRTRWSLIKCSAHLHRIRSRLWRRWIFNLLRQCVNFKAKSSNKSRQQPPRQVLCRLLLCFLSTLSFNKSWGITKTLKCSRCDASIARLPFQIK